MALRACSRRLVGPALALLLAGCAADEPRKADEPPTPVSLVSVAPAGGGEAVRVAGVVRLREETPLSFWTAGQVTRVAVRQGDRVAPGQLLASLDTRTIDSDVGAARADLARTQQDHARARSLLAQGWVPRARVDAAAAAEGSARAAYERATFAQRNARIVAPSAGVILERRVEPGQTVAAGEPVLLLGAYRAGYVLRVPLTAAQAASVRAGTTAQVDFPDGAAPPLVGRVIEIAGRADDRTGTFRVELALPDTPGLRSGQIAEARFPPAPTAAGGSLQVPATALFAARADEGFVWRYDPARKVVNARLVRLGRLSADGVEIRSGLAPGDRVVATGVDRLTEGMAVTLAPPAGARAAG